MSARPTDTQSHSSGSAGAPRRILILANEAIGDEGLVKEIVRHTEGRSAEALGRSGIQATGAVGEADPVLALEDGLRLFAADEVIIVTHKGEHGAWLENGVVERARREVDVPITVAELDHAEHDAPGRLENVREFPPPCWRA